MTTADSGLWQFRKKLRRPPYVTCRPTWETERAPFQAILASNCCRIETTRPPQRMPMGKLTLVIRQRGSCHSPRWPKRRVRDCRQQSVIFLAPKPSARCLCFSISRRRQSVHGPFQRLFPGVACLRQRPYARVPRLAPQSFCDSFSSIISHHVLHFAADRGAFHLMFQCRASIHSSQ